jgi:hypothetical protein
VDTFIDKLINEDLNSDAFKARMDSAFRIGKEEVSSAASLMTGRFMERNFVGMEDSAAYKAISDLRAQLDELNAKMDAINAERQTLIGVIWAIRIILGAGGAGRPAAGGAFISGGRRGGGGGRRPPARSAPLSPPSVWQATGLKTKGKSPARR